jgi:hypothetical protein
MNRVLGVGLGWWLEVLVKDDELESDALCMLQLAIWKILY